jgi:hypothetical protein
LLQAASTVSWHLRASCLHSLLQWICVGPCKSLMKVKVKVRVTLRLAVYHQSVRLGAKTRVFPLTEPLET